MSLVGVGILHGCFKNSDWSQLLYTRRNNWKLAFPGVTAEIIQEGTCLQFSPSVSLGQRSGKISGAWMRTFAGLETNFSSWIMLELNEALKSTRRQDKDFKKLRLIQKSRPDFFLSSTWISMYKPYRTPSPFLSPAQPPGRLASSSPLQHCF